MWTLEQTEKHLVELASKGVVQVYYSDLYPLAGVDAENRNSRDDFHDLLGEVSSNHYEKGLPMLSVIVVGKDDNKRPGGGFFKLARSLNSAYSSHDNETIFILELKKVEDHREVYEQLLQELQIASYELTEEDRAIIAQSQGLTFREGGKVLVSSYQYERDTRARKACIDAYGYDCAVCSYNFGQEFGEIGKGFIHVHHLNPLSQQDGEHEIDPINDLRPVCPNCHAMLHKRTPPYSIEELRTIRQQVAK